MIGPDNTGASLAISGFQGVDQMRREAEAKREGRMPIPTALAAYWERLAKGEDPRALAAEARGNPEIAQMLQGAQPQQPQGQPGVQPPQVSHVGPGTGGPGYPGLYTPQGTRNDMPPMQGLPPSQHAQSAAAIQPSQPVPAASRSFTGSLGQMGQPMQGAPQVAQPEGPAYPQQPGGGRAYPRQDFPTPQFKGPDTYSRSDFSKYMAPQMPTMIAAAGRRDVAEQQGQVKRDTQAGKDDTSIIVARLRQAGISEQTLAKLLLGTAQEQGKNERFVEGEGGKTARSKIAADAGIGVARVRTDNAGSNEQLKAVRAAVGDLRQQLATAGKSDRLFMPDGTMATRDEAALTLQRYEARLAQLSGVDAPPPKYGPPPPPGNGPPAKTPPAKKAGPQDTTVVRKVYQKSKNVTISYNAAGEVVSQVSGRQP